MPFESLSTRKQEKILQLVQPCQGDMLILRRLLGLRCMCGGCLGITFDLTRLTIYCFRNCSKVLGIAP